MRRGDWTVVAREGFGDVMVFVIVVVSIGTVAPASSLGAGASEDDTVLCSPNFVRIFPREILGFCDNDGLFDRLFTFVPLDGERTPVIGLTTPPPGPSTSFLFPFSFPEPFLPSPCNFNGNGVLKIDRFFCPFTFPGFVPPPIPSPLFPIPSTLLGIFVGEGFAAVAVLFPVLAVAVAFFSLIFANELAVGANNRLPIVVRAVVVVVDVDVAAASVVEAATSVADAAAASVVEAAAAEVAAASVAVLFAAVAVPAAALLPAPVAAAAPWSTTTQLPKPPAVVKLTRQRSPLEPPVHLVPDGRETASCWEPTLVGACQG